MTLVLGQRMVRVEDGMRGVVEMSDAGPRILYRDRGESRLALKSEKWVADELKPGRLRPEEMWLIAAYADRALRAHERHEPHKTWEKPDLDAPPYDKGLMLAIFEYLSQRETRPASE